MAIQFTDFSRAPLIDSGYADLFGNVLSGYKMAKEPEKMERDKRAKELAMRLQELAIEHMPRQYALADQLAAARAMQANAGAAKNVMLQQLFQRALGGDMGNQPTNAAMPYGETSYQGIEQDQMPLGDDQGMADINNIQMQTQQQPSPEQLAKHQQQSLSQAMIASKAVGFEPKIIDVDGVKTAVTAFGNFPIAKGMSPLQKELSKSDAKQIAEFEQTASAGIRGKPTLDELAKITSSPVFETMRRSDLFPGSELDYFMRKGTPEQREIAGNYMTYTNQLIKDSARDFAGQFRVGEQDLLERMKLSPKDTLDVARGKLSSLMLMRKLMTDRASLAAKLSRTGKYSPLQALEIADKQLNVEKAKDEIRTQVGLKPEIPDGMKKKGYTVKDIEATAKKHNMTPKQVIEQWRQANG